MTSKLIRSGLVLAALLAAPFAANAADLPRPTYKAPAYVAPAVPTWSGFYVGLNAGYGFGKSDWGSVGTPTDPEPKGALAGVTLGYNVQTGSWVWGLEGDVAWSGMKDDVACGPPAGSCETKVPWFGTARGRIGYAGWGNFMPYITGGAAFANVKASGPTGDDSSTRVGWTLGGGFEYMMWSAWSVKVEYLYADLGSFMCSTCIPGGSDVAFTTNVVRAGLNYRF